MESQTREVMGNLNPQAPERRLLEKDLSHFQFFVYQKMALNSETAIVMQVVLTSIPQRIQIPR